MSSLPVQRDITNGLELEIFGQMLTKIYTQICLIFPVGDESSNSTIVEILTRGLERLSAAFPWIAGQVICEGAGEGNTGTYNVVPLDTIPRLTVKDIRNDASAPTFDGLKKANFPINMLDESILAPRKTLPIGPSEEAAKDNPVFLVQATFIKGGLLLTFLGQHQVMDGTGQGHMIHLLSKACRGEKLTSDELSSANLVRTSLIPFLDDSYQVGPELDHQIVKPVSPDTTLPPPSPPAPSSWASFSFPSTSLATLKSLADKNLKPGISYISTDDALSAFIWQSTQRVRYSRLAPADESKFLRAIDVRQFLDVPKSYPGVIQNMTYSHLSLQSLVNGPLGIAASELRSAITPDIKFKVRALATYLKRTADKSTVNFTATFDASKDIMLSSWAKQNSYSLDFGLGLGTPAAVRRPRFEPVEGLIYLMPKALNGEITVALSLRDEDLERLKADEEFAKYATFDG